MPIAEVEVLAGTHAVLVLGAEQPTGAATRFVNVNLGHTSACNAASIP